MSLFVCRICHFYSIDKIENLQKDLSESPSKLWNSLSSEEDSSTGTFLNTISIVKCVKMYFLPKLHSSSVFLRQNLMKSISKHVVFPLGFAFSTSWMDKDNTWPIIRHPDWTWLSRYICIIQNTTLFICFCSFNVIFLYICLQFQGSANQSMSPQQSSVGMLGQPLLNDTGSEYELQITMYIEKNIQNCKIEIWLFFVFLWKHKHFKWCLQMKIFQGS